MIIRIVELHIRPENIGLAKELLSKVSSNVRGMKGCTHLRILEDVHKTNHITTYSYWNNEIDLNNYRDSDTFKNFWSSIKPLFALRPKAWSSSSIHYLP